jgi:hypothetical protein
VVLISAITGASSIYIAQASLSLAGGTMIAPGENPDAVQGHSSIITDPSMTRYIVQANSVIASGWEVEIAFQSLAGGESISNVFAAAIVHGVELLSA